MLMRWAEMRPVWKDEAWLYAVGAGPGGLGALAPGEAWIPHSGSRKGIELAAVLREKDAPIGGETEAQL